MVHIFSLQDKDNTSISFVQLVSNRFSVWLKMSFAENIWDDSFTMESCIETDIGRATPDSIDCHNRTIECPTLWPTMTYNQCNTDSDKEIWITMFDEETTMDLFPTPPVTPQITSNLQTLLKAAISSEDEPIQEVKSNIPVDKSLLKHLDVTPLAQKVTHKTIFDHFKWQAMQTGKSQPLQQTVKRRLVL